MDSKGDYSDIFDFFKRRDLDQSIIERFFSYPCFRENPEFCNSFIKCLIKVEPSNYQMIMNCPSVQDIICLQKCSHKRRNTVQPKSYTIIKSEQSNACLIENKLDKTHHLHRALSSLSELFNDNQEAKSNDDINPSNHYCLLRTCFINFIRDINCQYTHKSAEISNYEYLESLPYSENIIKAEISYNNEPKISTAIIINDSIALSDNEQCYYRNSSFFYSYLLRVNENIPQCILFLKEAKGILKENLMDFWKKRTQEKIDLKPQRIQQAIQLFKDLISDMQMYKNCGIDHHLSICPERILVYEGQETGLRFKLVSNEFEYKKANGNPVGQRVADIDSNKSLRYLPPEIAYSEYYYKKFDSSYEENYEARDVWAIGACVLSMMTDKMIDRWNYINWESSLAAIIIKEFAGVKGIFKCVSGSLLLDSRKRIKISEISKILRSIASDH